MSITLSYPETLPLPLNVLAYSNTFNSVQNNPDLGPPVNFKWSDQENLIFNLQWSFSINQLAEFLLWFNNDLYFGSRWFNLKLQWLTDTKGDVRPLECNFNGGKPAISNNGKRRNVSIAVTVRNPDRDSLEFYAQYIELVGLDNLSPLIDRLEIFSNTDMPENL
jgi:hypothetical protein